MKAYQNEHVTMRMNASIHLIRQSWTGLSSSANFRDGSLMALRLAKRHHIKRWLIDLRALRMFNPLDLHWFVQYWLPEATWAVPPNGRVAILLTDTNQFGKLGSDIILRAAIRHNPSLASRYVLDEEAAMQWLTTTH